MHGVNAIRNLNAMDVPTDVIFAAQKDASELAFMEGVLRTTMRATSDATTRRAIRIKLDALETMRAGTPAPTPNSIPAHIG